MAFSAKQQKAIAIAPKFTALLSVLGSGFIIFHVIRSSQKASRTPAATQHRLLIGMSVCDVLASAWFFLTTWPIPEESGVYGAIGNQASCTAQGFFSQLSLSVAMYNASLSIFYLTKIRCGWTTQRIQRRLEPLLHVCSLVIGIGTATAGVFLNLYNNDSWECWIAPLPTDCKESWKNGGVTDCTRGDNASLYRWVLYYIWLWLAIVLVIIDMLLVYRAVLAHEKAAERYDVTNERRRKQSKKVANQGQWYCGAFLITWFFPTITRLTQVIAGKTPYPLILITAMFVPVQGFFNFLVYIHPKYNSIKESWSSNALSGRSHASQTRSRSAVKDQNGPTSSISPQASSSGPAVPTNGPESDGNDQ